MQSSHTPIESRMIHLSIANRASATRAVVLAYAARSGHGLLDGPRGIAVAVLAICHRGAPESTFPPRAPDQLASRVQIGLRPLQGIGDAHGRSAFAASAPSALAPAPARASRAARLD